MNTMSYDQEASRRMAQNRQQQGAALPTAAALPPPVGRAAPIDPANVPRATRAALSSPVPDEPAAEPPSEANQCVERLQRLALGTPWWSSSQRSARASASLMSVLMVTRPTGSASCGLVALKGDGGISAAHGWYQLLTWEREATAGQALTLLLKLLGHTRSHAMVMAGVEALIHRPTQQHKARVAILLRIESMVLCAPASVRRRHGARARLELLLLLLLEALCADRMGTRALLSVDAVPLDLACEQEQLHARVCEACARPGARARKRLPARPANRGRRGRSGGGCRHRRTPAAPHPCQQHGTAQCDLSNQMVGEAFDEVCGEDALAVHSSERTLSPLQKLYAVRVCSRSGGAPQPPCGGGTARESVVAANRRTRRTVRNLCACHTRCHTLCRPGSAHVA